MLLQVIERDPHLLGVDRPTWSASALADYLERKTRVPVGEARVRQYLHAADYVVRRPTWSLKAIAQQQPEFEKKDGASAKS